MTDEEERSKRITLILDFIYRERLKNLDVPQILKDNISMLSGYALYQSVYELEANAKEQSMVDKEGWINVVERGIEQLRIGTTRKEVNQ